MQTTPVTFANGDGHRLFGILNRPKGAGISDHAILLLSPGVKMRVGPHRLYNKMAQRFTELGYTVLRFDFHGLGDAEGEAPEAMLADLYRATQLGRYVPDTMAAMDWMEREYCVRRFILAGLCGGALTGLLTAEHDDRVRGLLALSIPVILDGTGIDAARYMPVAQLELTRNAYLRRLRFWEMSAVRSWLRFATGQSDYRQILRAVVRPLSARIREFTRDRHEGNLGQPSDNTNPHFAPAFLRLVASGRPVLLVFAEADRLYWEFEEKFLNRHARALAAHRDQVELRVVLRANHVFSFAEWQSELLELSSAWLARLDAPVASGRPSQL